MQAFTPRRLTARPAESEQLSLQSTMPHYLVNSNKVWRVSPILIKKPKSLKESKLLFILYD
ncbi:hypothetical protein [Metabacillus bambusae]|uniref:Uncharacterized protein n=1 Tax=Metabacillus bambusae TaxID=2795218 RepID=A0ABS3N7C1_9BACI|nr:hypothetical protein [Metabacillus bambusae]MBO1514040.1 hypothetical protein [Metabacillus bambusae]